MPQAGITQPYAMRVIIVLCIRNPKPMSDSFSPYESAITAIAAKMPGAPLREALLTRLFLHVSGKLGDYFDATLKQHGLNYTTWTALVVLYSNPGQRMLPSELSVFINTSRTHCTRIADELVGKGWIQRAACEADRRQVFLLLTEQGKAFVETLHPQRREQYRHLWSAFSAEEQEQIDTLLHKMLSLLER
jgi:MarR family transcriptional repressor of emrRAB